MLAPDSRALLLDALRPPPGHSLDRAVATTYTLDLETALMVPLAFAGFRFDEEQDPVEVMEALREMGGRVDIFCQIGLPRARTRTTAHTGLAPTPRMYAYARTRRSAHRRKGPRKGP